MFLGYNVLKKFHSTFVFQIEHPIFHSIFCEYIYLRYLITILRYFWDIDIYNIKCSSKKVEDRVKQFAVLCLELQAVSNDMLKNIQVDQTSFHLVSDVKYSSDFKNDNDPWEILWTAQTCALRRVPFYPGDDVTLVSVVFSFQ